MTKIKLIVFSIIVAVAIFGYGIYYMFVFMDTGTDEISNSKYGTYKNEGVADQEAYDSKIVRHAIGITSDGDYVYELKNDPSHEHLIVIVNTEMPPWFFYTLKK